MTDIPLMHDAIAREVLYQARYDARHRWPPWVTDREPPVTGTYLTRVVNRDGHRYVQCHYWSATESGGEWLSVPKCWAEVEAWMEAPPV